VGASHPRPGTTKEGGNMPATKAQQKAVAKYMKNNYDELKIRMAKGKKADVAAHADKVDGSLNKFINRAIDEAMERDNTKAGD